MNENIRLYKCPVCGNVVVLIEGDMKHITCCGIKMEEMVANSMDASVEKHVPVYERVADEVIVRVGSNSHPMDETIILCG